MIENMQIIFDFKNSKEYLSSYTLEGIDDKKIILKMEHWIWSYGYWTNIIGSLEKSSSTFCS